MSIKINGMQSFSKEPYNARNRDLHRNKALRYPTSAAASSAMNKRDREKPELKPSVRLFKKQRVRQTEERTSDTPIFSEQRLPLSIPAEVDTLAARTILASGGFNTKIEDLSKPKDSGMTVSQMQGDLPIRRTALCYIQTNLMALTPHVLRSAKMRLNKNFRILQLKRLGHALNFAPMVKLSDNSTVSLRGFSEAFTIPMIASSLLQYSQQKIDLQGKQGAAWVSQVIQKSISNDNYDQKSVTAFCQGIRNPDCKDVFSVSSGYDWHVTHIFFFRGYLIYCNRGFGSGEFSGVSVYRIKSRNRVTEDLLKKLVQRHNLRREEWSKHYNIFALKDTLGLELVYHAKQKPQKVGNCTYTSTKSGAKGGFALVDIIKKIGDSAPPPDPNFWKGAFDESLLEYKSWNFFDKTLVIQDFVNDLPVFNRDPDELLSQGEIKKLSDLIAEKVKIKPVQYEEVSRYFQN